MFELPLPLLSLDQVSFAAGRGIVSDISLSLYPGEILCLLGKSGAGKSTLLRIAAGLLRPTSGRVWLRTGDRDHLSQYDLAEQDLISLRRRSSGFVAQNARDTLNMKQSAAANIAEPLFDNGDRNFGKALAVVRHWFVALGLDEARIYDRPEVFSGGMQQRLQIARALVHEPRFLFLDEPTTGLDSAAQARLLMLLSALQRRTNVAMILVTHDLRIARLIAHRVLVLDEGRLVEEAPPDRLIADPRHPAARELVSAMI
ncbi:ATP-binding cassette domain-containing protein [Brucella sp. C7-11G]